MLIFCRLNIIHNLKINQLKTKFKMFQHFSFFNLEKCWGPRCLETRFWSVCHFHRQPGGLEFQPWCMTSLRDGFHAWVAVVDRRSARALVVTDFFVFWKWFGYVSRFFVLLIKMSLWLNTCKQLSTFRLSASEYWFWIAKTFKNDPWNKTHHMLSKF